MNEPIDLNQLIQAINLQPRVDIKKSLLTQVENVIKQNKLNCRVDFTKDGQLKLVDLSESTDSFLIKFITKNENMLRLKEVVRKLAPIDDVVLIVGPTGTGKEIVARALHGEREGKFIAVNCAGLPETLIESLVFGHMQGSFTGATKTTKGLMKQADGGTFFLDEIGELPLQMQGKFLRAIQERRIRKLGAEETEEINCRIVCATNKNLYDLVEAKLFRLDLLARISTFELFTLGLDRRPEDIEPILESLDPTFVSTWKSTQTIPIDRIDVRFNVRSLQQHVRRWQVLKI